MFRKKFYYGAGTDHVVKLTQIQADSVLNLRITQVTELDNGMYANVEFVGPGNMEAYNQAADILNEYLKTHSVPYTEADEAAGLPVLRPVK